MTSPLRNIVRVPQRCMCIYFLPVPIFSASKHCKGVKLKLFGSGYDVTEGLGVDQLDGGVALPKLSIKSRC